jgi:hypothetical protein
MPVTPFRPSVTGALTAICILLSSGALSGADATPAPKSFKSPEAAATALFEAAKARSQRTVLRILGSIHKRWIISGDHAMDTQMAARFVTAYAQKSSVVMEGPDKAVLIVGADDFPVPFPIVREGDRWFFDAHAGKQELLNRRIGRDELAAMETLRAIVEAQKEYAASKSGTGGAPEYAARFKSSPGAKDGLYWPDQEGQPQSPLGPLIAQAVRDGDIRPEDARDGPIPYHGYYFRILTGQGPQAEGGALDYMTSGKLTGGFAVVAYPAKYGVSGIMSFMVNRDGAVFESDLGKATASEAKRMEKFDPDAARWKKV